MSNYGRYEQGQPTGGDIAVQMWAEACGEEELERIKRFLGAKSVEGSQDE